MAPSSSARCGCARRSRHQQPQPAHVRGHARHHARSAAARAGGPLAGHRERHPRAGATCGACARPASMRSWSAKRSCAPPDPGQALAACSREPLRDSRCRRCSSRLPRGLAPRSRSLRRASRRARRCCGFLDGAPRAGAVDLSAAAAARARTHAARRGARRDPGPGPVPRPGAGRGAGVLGPAGVALPPSLRNIFSELRARPRRRRRRAHGCLERWARQGVLLLNTALTVEEGSPGSHAGRGWEALTDA